MYERTTTTTTTLMGVRTWKYPINYVLPHFVMDGNNQAICVGYAYILCASMQIITQTSISRNFAISLNNRSIITFQNYDITKYKHIHT